MLFSKATWLHLRIPFSVFLMPVFSFAASQSSQVGLLSYFLVFAALHLFVYPASNGFNSYYDKDEGSIGGLERPPKVSDELLHASLIFDGIGLLLALAVSWRFALMVFIYGLASKAYSHPAIRLKKYAWGGLLTVGFFQGFFTYLACITAFDNLAFGALADLRILLPAALTSLLFIGSYPMTQIYQHKEDGERGDHTLSLFLGIKGTFLFTGFSFFLVNAGFYLFFMQYSDIWRFVAFQIFLLPVLLYFVSWYLRASKDPAQADFRSTMRLNQLSSVCMILFFTFLMFWKP